MPEPGSLRGPKRRFIQRRKRDGGGSFFGAGGEPALEPPAEPLPALVAGVVESVAALAFTADEQPPPWEPQPHCFGAAGAGTASSGATFPGAPSHGIGRGRSGVPEWVGGCTQTSTRGTVSQLAVPSPRSSPSARYFTFDGFSPISVAP